MTMKDILLDICTVLSPGFIIWAAGRLLAGRPLAQPDERIAPVSALWETDEPTEPVRQTAAALKSA